jgi:hypothetical protein
LSLFLDDRLKQYRRDRSRTEQIHVQLNILDRLEQQSIDAQLVQILRQHLVDERQHILLIEDVDRQRDKNERTRVQSDLSPQVSMVRSSIDITDEDNDNRLIPNNTEQTNDVTQLRQTMTFVSRKLPTTSTTVELYEQLQHMRDSIEFAFEHVSISSDVNELQTKLVRSHEFDVYLCL